MPEDLSCVSQVAFSITSSYDDLGSDAESEPDHEHYHIVHNSNGRCSEFNLSDSSEEGRVGQSDHLLHHQAYQDRECYRPDVPI